MSVDTAAAQLQKVGKFENRQSFKHDGRVVYEWEQSMEEVLIYITPPEGLTGQHLDIKITNLHLRVGIKGNPPFLDVRGCRRGFGTHAILTPTRACSNPRAAQSSRMTACGCSVTTARLRSICRR
jgi:hypothetical protein